jgi:hypothetical protein
MPSFSSPEKTNPQPPQKATPKRIFIRRVLLFISGLAFGLILAEVGLRLAGFTYFNPSTYDSELGFALRPNAEGWWTREGSAYIKINSRGLRDYEHQFQKPNNTIRIAVLGDSFAEAFQVSTENTFWSVMQRELQSALAPQKKQVEVLNFGVSGFSTARELIMLRQRVWQYEPDVVVLQITPGNDIRDNSRVLAIFTDALPYFVYKDGSLVLDDSLLKTRNAELAYKLRQSFAGQTLNWFRDHSRVLGLAYTLRESFSATGHQRVSVARADNEPGVSDDVFRSPINKAWADAWSITERLIVQMRDEVQAKGARFLVVTVTTGLQVDPDATARTEYMKKLGVTTLSYPDSRLKALGDRENIDVLNLAPSFMDFATQNQTYLHGFGNTKGHGHWNEVGHKLAGELIAERLREKL